ncbi:MAG: hypothetical protein ACFFBZ_15810, partial [Promethearchaeota archaeon]
AFLHGFMIKKKYHKTIDIFKAFIGCITYLWKKYKDKIFLWYGEMRTNEAISQFFTSLIGMKPIAFLPNKDIFYSRVESDILHVIYSKAVLDDYRFEEKPQIIRQVLNCYNYTNNRYHFGLPTVENPNITLDQGKINIIRKLVRKKIKEDKFGYQNIKFSIWNKYSNFKFFLNPFSKNIEKINYNITDLEELYVFIEKLQEIIKEMDINYAECYVSSYKPKHQKIFYNAGFRPRGYVPSWNYNKEVAKFEDQIIFNYFKGNLDKNMKIIPETNELLENLNQPIEEDSFESLVKFDQ